MLIVLHRALQNIKVNRKVFKDLKQKEHLIISFDKKNADAKYNDKMYKEITKQYATYVRFYLNVACKTDILTKESKKVSDHVRTLSGAKILQHYEMFEALVV